MRAWSHFGELSCDNPIWSIPVGEGLRCVWIFAKTAGAARGENALSRCATLSASEAADAKGIRDQHDFFVSFCSRQIATRGLLHPSRYK